MSSIYKWSILPACVASAIVNLEKEEQNSSGPVTPGLVEDRRPAVLASAALARTVRPGLRHGFPARAEMVSLTFIGARNQN